MERKEKVPNELNEFGYPNYVAYPNTDWEKVLFKDKVMNEHNVSLNGATDKVSFWFLQDIWIIQESLNIQARRGIRFVPMSM